MSPEKGPGAFLKSHGRPAHSYGNSGSVFSLFHQTYSQGLSMVPLIPKPTEALTWPPTLAESTGRQEAAPNDGGASG